MMEVIILVVKQEEEITKIIKNPDNQVQLEAVKHNGRVIEHIKNPDFKIVFEALKSICTR